MGKAMSIDYQTARTGQELLHALRYYLARGFVEPDDVVLDLGAGTGYGSYMLSLVAKEVFAYDIEDNFGKSYERKNINFQKIDLRNFSLPVADAVVGIEFIEHTEKPKQIVEEIKKKARKFIILSYPQRPTAGLDPTHLSNLESEEVRTWIEDQNWLCIFEHSFGLSIFQVFKHYKDE